MGYRVKEIREARGMTQEMLAQKAGVSRATISGMESGRVTVVTTKTLDAIACALEMDIHDLFLSSKSLTS